MKSKFQLGPIQTKWLESLEAHPKRQMKSSLGTKKQEDGDEYKACCLGELGLIAGLCEWRGTDLTVTQDGCKISDTYLINVWEELGLRSERGSADDGEESNDLAELNDGGYSWPDIAARIRKNPEAYLTKSI